MRDRPPARTCVTCGCLCGETGVIWTTNPRGSAQAFYEQHQGDGHGWCSPAEAAKIRRRNARERERAARPIPPPPDPEQPVLPGSTP